ncbi:MAG: serine/threonine protein kinase [Anaerolineae bacterium]|nr:serine/threonine protein kinase [Anaerolineae bacterium]
MFDTIAYREIGRYTVHELIGWSGMSRVYRATDSSRGEAEVALKVISDSITSNAAYEQRFMKEIEIAGLLYHPHILPIIDFGREQGVLFMVMPLVSGGTLADVLRLRRSLSPRQTLAIAEQIGSALDYVHGFRIVHRDVKPANILLYDGGNTMLADFGLVRHVDDPVEASSGDIVGSPMYMSPEQERGDALDHRSDLYSLGLVLYECLTGRLPYNPRPDVEITEYHVTTPPIPPCRISSHFPACLEAPLLRGVEKDRAMRFRSGREMADALSAAIDALGYEDADRPLVLQEEIEESRRLTEQGMSCMVVPVMASAEEIAA